MEKQFTYSEDTLFNQYVKIVERFYNASNNKPDKYMSREDMFKRGTFGWTVQLYSEIDEYITSLRPFSASIYQEIANSTNIDIGTVAKIINSNYIHMTLSIINKKTELEGNEEYNSFWSMQRYRITVNNFRDNYRKFKPFYDGTIPKKHINYLSSCMYPDQKYDLVKDCLSKTTGTIEFICFLNTLINDSKNPAITDSVNNKFVYNLRSPDNESDDKAIITYNPRICNLMIDDILSSYDENTDNKNIQRLRSERNR